MLALDGFRGRVAVVTGASRGIGARTAEMLRDQGATVAGLDIAPVERDGIFMLECDVAHANSVTHAFNRIRNELGDPAILVNNAAIYRLIAFQDVTVPLWERTIAVNLTGAFLCAQQVLPAMKRAGYGRLVAISSTAAKTGGWVPAGAYAASKGGLASLAKSIAAEYARFGVISNVAAPSMIDTPMISPAPDAAASIPVGRLGTPDDVASLVVYLCSAHASYMTGEVIDLAGGYFID